VWAVLSPSPNASSHPADGSNHLEKLSPNRRADEQSTTISLTVEIHANNRVNNFKQHVQHQLSRRRRLLREALLSNAHHQHLLAAAAEIST